MSNPPTLLLTRPLALSERTAERVRAALPDASIVISPIMEIRQVSEVPDLGEYAGVILTSQNAASMLPPSPGVRAYTVGAKTARAATDKGLRVEAIFENAEDMVWHLDAKGPLLHLHGTHTRGDVAKKLSSAGIVTKSHLLYSQDTLKLTAKARAALMSNDPVILPLFSPRSAALVAKACSNSGANLHPLSMSPAVRQSWFEQTGRDCQILSSPTSDAMLDHIVALMRV